MDRMLNVMSVTDDHSIPNMESNYCKLGVF